MVEEKEKVGEKDMEKEAKERGTMGKEKVQAGEHTG